MKAYVATIAVRPADSRTEGMEPTLTGGSVKMESPPFLEFTSAVHWSDIAVSAERRAGHDAMYDGIRMVEDANPV